MEKTMRMYIVLAVIFSLGTLLSDTSSLWAQGRDIQPGYLGVTADESALGRGAEVMRVVDGSPANKVGIQPGDIILAVDEHIVNDLKAMVTEMRERPAGRSVKIDFLRKNRLHRVEVTLSVRPAPTPLPGQPMPPTRDLISQLIGLELVTLKSTNRNPGGVMVVDVLFDATGAGPRIPIDAI
ncbi:MAG: PDZ domain-containing protein, partial [Pirellulaceae bacterium]